MISLRLWRVKAVGANSDSGPRTADEIRVEVANERYNGHSTASEESKGPGDRSSPTKLGVKSSALVPVVDEDEAETDIYSSSL